jgi:hypothetical protein
MDNTTSTSKHPFMLYPGMDFTTSALADYLNEKYKTKKTGQKFLIGDIQQYLRRGYLPRPYGHHPISIVENEQIGIKIVRVDFNATKK